MNVACAAFGRVKKRIKTSLVKNKKKEKSWQNILSLYSYKEHIKFQEKNLSIFFKHQLTSYSQQIYGFAPKLLIPQPG